MKIEIETKYDVGDIVIGYKPKYGFVKYIIKDVIVEKRSYDYSGGIEYLCEKLTDDKFRESFAESELFTADDIYERLNKFLTYPTTTKQAKHDLDMYRAIVDALPSANCNYMVYNTTYWDCRKWLENKFPELEQFINKNIR